MILDDGGDATLLVHNGRKYEQAGAVPDPSTADSEESTVILELLTRSLTEDPQRYTRIAEGIRGATEETTTVYTGSISWPRPGSCCSRRSTSTTR